MLSKQLFSVGVVIVCTLIVATTVEARYLIKHYHNPGSPKAGHWEFMWVDHWGGDNYQCRPPGSSCHLWDWVAVYRIEMVGGTDPCPSCNTVDYWYNLTRDAAAAVGTQLPPDPPPSAQLLVNEYDQIPPEYPRP